MAEHYESVIQATITSIGDKLAKTGLDSICVCERVFYKPRLLR